MRIVTILCVLTSVLGARSASAEGNEVELHGGLWFAKLSRPEVVPDMPMITAADNPDQDVGTGSGVLRQLGFSLSLADNRLAFDYMTDQLLGDDTAGSGKLGRESLRLITGQLMPALGGKVKPIVEVTSGSFEGGLKDPGKFIRHDGEKYLPRGLGGWKSSLFAAGLRLRFGEERPSHVPDFYSTWALGFRYTHFGIPTVSVGNSSIGMPGQAYLIDSAVSMYEPVIDGELGYKYVLARFGGGLGYGVTDFGKWGRYTGMSMSMNGLLQVRVPFSAGPVGMALTGGVSFQMWVVVPPSASPKRFAEGMPDGDLGGGSIVEASIASSMYLLWGPQVGLEVRL